MAIINPTAQSKTQNLLIGKKLFVFVNTIAMEEENFNNLLSLVIS